MSNRNYFPTDMIYKSLHFSQDNTQIIWNISCWHHSRKLWIHNQILQCFKALIERHLFCLKSKKLFFLYLDFKNILYILFFLPFLNKLYCFLKFFHKYCAYIYKTFVNFNSFDLTLSEPYLGPCKTSMTEYFEKIFNDH